MKKDEDIAVLLKRRSLFDEFLEQYELDSELSTCPACAYPSLEYTKGNPTCEFCGWDDDGLEEDHIYETWIGPIGPIGHSSLSDVREKEAGEFQFHCELTSRKAVDQLSESQSTKAAATLQSLAETPLDLQKSSFEGRSDIRMLLFMLVTEPNLSEG